METKAQATQFSRTTLPNLDIPHNLAILHNLVIPLNRAIPHNLVVIHHILNICTLSLALLNQDIIRVIIKKWSNIGFVHI